MSAFYKRWSAFSTTLSALSIIYILALSYLLHWSALYLKKKVYRVVKYIYLSETTYRLLRYEDPEINQDGK